MGQFSIAQIRQLVRSLRYLVASHCADELEDDNLTILDLESIVLTGTIKEIQRDRKTRESKYVIQGRTIEGFRAEVVAKLGLGGKLIFITVYVC
jgi:ABC-type multidrug transport system ATPase subunit